MELNESTAELQLQRKAHKIRKDEGENPKLYAFSKKIFCFYEYDAHAFHSIASSLFVRCLILVCSTALSHSRNLLCFLHSDDQNQRFVLLGKGLPRTFQFD